jgi:hypothetical protein
VVEIYKAHIETLEAEFQKVVKGKKKGKGGAARKKSAKKGVAGQKEVGKENGEVSGPEKKPKSDKKQEKGSKDRSEVGGFLFGQL